MRDNPVRAKLAKGGTALGHMAFEFFTPGLAQIMANAGAEFVILDQAPAYSVVVLFARPCAVTVITGAVV